MAKEAQAVDPKASEIVDRMQELLTAERAGVQCLVVMADQASDGERKVTLSALRNEEGRYCADLFRLLRARGASPSQAVGAFADKVLALPGEDDRLALLVKGQSWVLRKIGEIPQDALTDEERGFFVEMREGHEAGIAACRKYLP
jgi:nitronate monooxygenase